MTFPVADVTLSPLVPFAWAVFVGLVFSLVGAAGGILAAVGHMTVLGMSDANTVKPMNQLLVVVSPLVSVPAYWRQRRLVLTVAVLVGSGAVVGSLVGSWYSMRHLASMGAYRTAFGVLTLVIALRLFYETTARFRDRHTRLRETSKAFERTAGAAWAAGRGGITTSWGFPTTNIVLAGHAFPCNVVGLVATGLLVAFVSSVLGVGGGFLLVPYLASWLGLPMFVVAGTSALAVLIASATSLGNYVYLGARVDWLLALVEVGGVVLGSLLGPLISRHMREQWLRLALAVVLLYIGTAYAISRGFGRWLGV